MPLSRATTTPIKSALPLSEPQYIPEHNNDVDVVSASTTNSTPIDDPLPEADNSVITSTAVTIVGKTPEYGITAFRAQNDDEGALGIYSTEPPKKKQRSAAAILLGAAVETVIFTGAVALSAYQLLTGKGRQQMLEEQGTKTGTEEEAATNAVVVSEKPLADKHMLRIESAPVNIPTQPNRHRHAGHMAKSLHHPTHHYRSKQGRASYKNRQGGLSTSLPHAHTYGNDLDFLKEGNLTLPGRPNTGTEDNDEQFLRMEAQLTTLIAEGKRALNSRIQDWAEETAPLAAAAQ
ncbi:hypothetical protein BGZ51_001899 [Haplosporangium sp. Z 767]|nr:hypothetical protein BGZ50_009739 [Haplosporangium sp. Z 11]KAF9193913.1 hypothetical protein BGZ51_001899 [Haplosporangium sp. Z 767]